MYSNKSNYFVIALLLNQISASTTADETFGATLAGCQSFASKFANTCSSTSTQLTFANVPTATMSCTGDWDDCGGTVSGTTCTWQRKLCVTCYDDSGVTKIHVQSNSQPNHCYYTPIGKPSDLEIDFTANWMSAAPEIQTITEQGALNELLCDLQGSSSVPTASGYVDNTGGSAGSSTPGSTGGMDQLTFGWGIAASGVMIYNAMAGTGVDAFYPAPYISSKTMVTDAAAATERVDYCLAHPGRDYDFHYHLASPCALDSSGFQFGSDYQGDLLAYMESEWMKVPYQSVFGVSKDGRPIYTPYNNNGQKRDNCQVDICNGFTDSNGNYAYQTTMHFPYIMGCYGAGNSPDLYPQCTTNPRLCNVLYYDGAVNLKALTWAAFASAALLFTLF